MRTYKEKLIAVAYFYFNSVGLPAGLTLTALLSPIFTVSLIAKGYSRHLFAFLGIWFVFFVAHLQTTNTEWEAYFRSSLLLFATFIFCVTVFHFSKNRVALEAVMRFLVRTAFLASLLCMLMYWTPLRDTVWKTENISWGLSYFSRLTMLTYESSYLSTLLVPLWFYVFWCWVTHPSTKNLLQTLMIAFPLILSFSLGVLASIALATMVCFIVRLQSVLQNTIILRVAVMVSIIGVFLLATENPLSMRINNVISGQDHSGKNRTVVSFELASQVNELENPWWGVGFGQIKTRGDFILRKKWPEWPINEPVRLPNLLAEVWASLGLVGLSLRILLLLCIFYYCKIFKNHFQLSLFVFVFIYQFQGSFMTNMAEAAILGLSAYPTFPEFDKASALATQRN